MIEDVLNSPAFRARIAESVQKDFGPAICPIVGMVKGRALQCGTGTLFKIGDRRFIITAAHVMETMSKAEGDPLISDHAPHSAAVPLYDSRAVMFRNKWGDCAVVEVQPAIVEHVPNRRWVTMLDFAYPPPTPNDLYYVCGYPSQLTETTASGGLSHAAMGFLTFGIGHDGLGDFDDTLNLAFRGPDGTERTTDGVLVPSSLKGISGSAVWRVYSGEPESSWKSDGIKIIGIQTGVYERKKAIKATVWGAVLQMLWKHFEDLRPSIRLHLDDAEIRTLEQRFR